MSVEKVRQQLRRVVDERDDLLVRHPRRTDDADDPGQRPGMVLGGDHGEIAKPGVFVLRPDGDRNARRFPTLPQRFRDGLRTLRQLQEASHPPCFRELWLLRQYGSLTEDE